MLFSESLYIYILVCGDDMVWNSGIIDDSNNLMLSVGILINVVHISHMFANVCHVCDMLAICLPDLPYIYICCIYIYTLCIYKDIILYIVYIILYILYIKYIYIYTYYVILYIYYILYIILYILYDIIYNIPCVPYSNSLWYLTTSYEIL